MKGPEISGLVLVLVVGGIWLLPKILPTPAPAPGHIDTPQEATIHACRDDWRKCADNEAMVNNYGGWSMAQVRCQAAADKEAKFGDPKWPWFAFGYFTPGKTYVSSGEAFLIEPDAQFANGFGAMEHMRVVCNYSLTTSSVIGVLVTARQGGL